MATICMLFQFFQRFSFFHFIRRFYSKKTKFFVFKSSFSQEKSLLLVVKKRWILEFCEFLSMNTKYPSKKKIRDFYLISKLFFSIESKFWFDLIEVNIQVSFKVNHGTHNQCHCVNGCACILDEEPFVHPLSSQTS